MSAPVRAHLWYCSCEHCRTERAYYDEVIRPLWCRLRLMRPHATGVHVQMIDLAAGALVARDGERARWILDRVEDELAATGVVVPVR